jgi:hypothetical protein
MGHVIMCFLGSPWTEETIKIFNNLPLEIKNVAGNQKKFKIALKKFFTLDSFYTMEEYLSQSWICTVSQNSLL